MRAGRNQQDTRKQESLESDRRLFLFAARKLNQGIMIHLKIPALIYKILIALHASNHCQGKMEWEQFLDFLPDWGTVDSEVKSAAPGNPIIDFRDMLLEWSKRWHLDADWCRDYAISAIRLWEHSKAARLYCCWDSLDLWSTVQERLKISDQLSKDEQEYLHRLNSDPGTFGIRVSRQKQKNRDELFNPFIPPYISKLKSKSKLIPMVLSPMQPLNEYLRRTRNWLEQHQTLARLPESKRQKTISKLLAGPVRRHKAQVERYFKSLGWKQVRQKPEQANHIMWSASYQVLGLTPEQIALTRPTILASTVSQAISRVLKHLDLPSRKKQGRPRKKNR